MRVALALHTYDRARGGAERYTADLVADLAARGHEVHVWAHQVMREEHLPRGVTVHRVGVSPGGGRGAWRFALHTHMEQQRLQADIVHSVGRTYYHNIYQPHGGTAPATRRATLSLAPTGLRPVHRLVRDTLSLRWQIYRGIERRALLEGRRQPPLVIAISDMVRRHLLEAYDLPEEHVVVIHNGVDTDRFSPARVRRMREHIRQHVLRVAPDVPVLLLVSHNHALKGLRHAIGALSLLERHGQDAVLAVCGRGRQGPYERLARQLRVEDRVRWVGATVDIEDFYGAADVLVHPTAYDPCSLVVLEALAAGLPVITTRQNGAAELLTEGKEGYVLERGEASALADRCAILLESEGHRRECGARARELALTRSRERHVVEILAAYARAQELGITPEPD